MFGPKCVWGLDVGRFGLKAVKVAKAGDQLKVLEAELIEYDWGSMDGETSGDAVLEAARALLLKHDIGKGDRVYVAMPGQAVFTRFVNLPPVEKKRIPEIVKFEARQQIPFNIEDVIWAYQPVKEEQLPGEEIEIGLFAIKRELVLDFLANLSALQQSLYGVQIAPLALYNFFRYDQHPEAPAVVVDVGAENTDLVIVDGQKFWTRNLPVAGNDITKAIRDKFDISFEEAENVKRMAAQSKHARQVFEVMEPVLRDLVSEVQRTIGYYKSLAKEVKFEEVVVLGNAFRLAGMQKFLSDNLQYPVRAFDSPRMLEMGPSLSAQDFKENFMTFVPALGLAVQGLGLAHMRINLLPEEFEETREIRRKKPLAVASAACLLLAVACGFVRENSRKNVLQEYKSEGVDIVNKAQSLDKKFRQAWGKVDAAKGPALEMAAVGRLPELGYERRFWFDFIRKFFDEKTGCVPKEVYLKYFIVTKGKGQAVRDVDLMRRGGAVSGDENIKVILEGTTRKPDEFIHKNVRDKILAFKPIDSLKSPVTKNVRYLQATPQPIEITLDSGETVPGVKFIIAFDLKTFDEAMAPAEPHEGGGDRPGGRGGEGRPDGGPQPGPGPGP